MVEKKALFDRLLAEVKKSIECDAAREETLLRICTLLRDRVPYYDWVGFYLVDGDRELVLGPFVGEPTAHIRIAFGRGICGQAAEKKEMFVVQDVSLETNYLSCSSKVQSEIVVPIFKNGEVVGELDIDSHVRSPFTEEDSVFLEEVCGVVSKLF